MDAAGDESTVRLRKGKHVKEKHDGGDCDDTILTNNNNRISMRNLLVEAVEKEKVKFVKKLEKEVNELTEEIVNAAENRNFLWLATAARDGDGVTKRSTDNSLKRVKSVFHDKEFRPRNSLLTDLFKVNHISTIYHIFIAFLINLVINTAVYDLVKFGKINLGISLIVWNFQSLPIAALIWLTMQWTTIAVYFGFTAWASNRALLSKSALKLWDVTWLSAFVLYQVVFLIVPASVIIHEGLTIAISFSVLMEQTRFLMKTYSFVRTTAPRALAVSSDKPRLPTLQMYVYFLFAPTLVYRDEYPRTTRIRWKIVVQHFLEVVGVVFYLAFIMENYLIPSARDFGKTRTTAEELLIVFFNNNLPCVFVLLCGFYSFLHSWMNAFAELMRFADRMFYQDWWNSSSFAEYYKTWNVVVHDWLYTFVYKDGTENLTKRKTASTWLVFIISALFHEYILALTFKFCYPVLFIVFGIIGTCLVFIPKKRSSVVGNVLLWLGIFTGTGCCGSLYMLEYYARINCPRSNSSPIHDFFIPRSWTCTSSAIK